ncbi:RNA polymerase sigma factor [Nonomuraea polychroma]|uniref:RNA polymerase sigma factor n=1 Tax=Nonomuraea polychroma TaxID=46176 RepID=UPI003D92D28C
MWRTLSDESRQAIRDLCDQHGARLYDYCRTELAAGDAEQAVAGALLTAHLYADRVTDLGMRRPWLYGLARAHRAIVAKPASIGSWSRPGRMSELLPEALLSLDRPQRELLDLSVRHGLSDAELAVIFELDAARVGTVVAHAAAGLEGWFAAIMAARGRDGCPDLTARMAEWVAAPGRRARARIGRHIQSCATCRAAPRTMTAGALLRRLPITTVPGTLPNRLPSAQPLPGEGPVWRVDGFPAQARLLVEPRPADTGPMEAGPAVTGPLNAGPARTGPAAVPPAAEATPHVPIADPTTANPGEPWSAAGAAAADQEHLAARPVRGRHPFTPPSRTRAFRGGVHGDKLVYSAALKGESNGFHKPPGEIIRYGGITLSGELDELQGRQWQEYWRDRANDDDPEAGAPVRAVVRLALILGVGLLAAGLVWAMLNAREHPATITKAASQTSVLLEEPSRWVAEVTTAAKAGVTSVPRKAELPRPAPPRARLSPASVWLGSQRTGSFTLSCTGRCSITSAVGGDGIEVSGTRFRVREPVSRPGCGERATVRRGKIVVQWAGKTTGDGTRTGGTTTAKGTLTLSVSWTVAQDKGVRLLDADGVRWSNCR